MKKIAAVTTLLFLTACIYAGDVNVLKSRNKIFSFWQTEKIDYYSSESDRGFLASSQEITEENIARGVILSTKTGDLMASSKTKTIDVYDTEVLEPTKDAVMSSSYSPLYLRKGVGLESVGEVKIDGERYMLARHEKSGDIIIVSGNGKIYDHIGRIVDGRLSILDINFFIEPEDVRLVPVIKSNTETLENTSGFELYYTGLANQEIGFSYVGLGSNGGTESFTFPANKTKVVIRDLTIRIIEAGYNKITYIIE